MSLDFLSVVSLREEARGLVVRPCLWLAVCMLWRLVSPWGSPSSDLEAVSSRPGDTLLECKSSVRRLPSDAVRPDAECHEQGSLMETRAPGGVLGYYCCVSVASHTTLRWIVLILRIGTHTPARTQAH